MIPMERLNNIYDRDWCRRHKKRPVRLLNLLQRRELGVRRPGSHLIDGQRDLYQCFKLECTSSMQPSNFTPIRFTPDGQQLIQFNVLTNEVVVSRYNGVASVANSKDSNAQKLLTKQFSTTTSGTLSRDLCLITSDSQHMIIGYIVQLPEQSSIMSRFRKNNESTSTGFNLESTTFMTIDLKKGAVCDTVCLENDSIRLSGGIYLVDRLLGILSIQHQTIYLYRIDKNSGSFEKIVEIGRSLYEDDNLYLNSVPSNPRTERVFTGFRNRLINYFYAAHKRAGSTSKFLRTLHQYLSLKIQKMQFLGPDILLLRLGIGTGTETTMQKEEVKQICSFVLFDWRKAEILAVHNRFSDTLFKLYVENTESFQQGSILQNCYPTTMEHCQILRQQQHENIIEALVASSSPESATRVRNRTLNMLPCSGIGIPVLTPFLDANLFSFDDRLLTCIENGRLSINTDLKIFCRKTSSPVLSIDFSQFMEPESVCRVIFHPIDPLLLVSKHYCSDSPTHIFTPPSFGKRRVASENVPGTSSQNC